MDVKASDLILYGALAIGAYLVYQAIAPLLQGVGSAASALATGASTAINATSTGIANLWVSLTQAAPINVLGNVVFPNGAAVPISQMPVRTDASGNVYVNSGGVTYQLQPSDANGNWPAVAVGT